jgi:uncharacterized protein (DUF2249 family)
MTDPVQASGTEPIVDVRAIEPRYRHPLIFDTFDNLPVGQSMVLVNDHEPRPLYYQFLHERSGQFDWAYLQDGPIEWQVRIVRVSSGESK